MTAISLVHGPTRAQSITSTISITLANTPTKGNTLVAVIGCSDYSGVTVSSISEVNASWTKQVSKQRNDGSSDVMDVEVWIAYIGNYCASKSITVNLSTTPAEGAAADIFEYNGIISASPLDKTATAYTAGTDPNTGTTDTTTINNELWIGGMCIYENQDFTGATNGFTFYDGIRVTGVTHWIQLSVVAKIASSTGTASSALTPSANCNSAGCICTLKGLPISITKTVTTPIDVLFKKLNIVLSNIGGSLNVDTIFKALGVVQSSDIDVILAYGAQYNIDTVLEKFGITKPFSIDTLLKTLNVPVTYSIDTKMLFITWMNYAIDTQLQKLGITKGSSTDVILKKLGITTADSIDVVFKKFGVTTTTSIDVILQSLIPPAPVYDVPETLYISNGSSSLWARPINWKESQECSAAIRPIPLAQSEYLDSDTWVLKPRTIECELRLSDREKDIFETIYDNAPIDGSNKYLDFYLLYYEKLSNGHYIPYYAWHYLVWIKSKSYTFEYSLQVNRYVRWWTLTLQCDVQQFSGSSSVLPTWNSTAPTIIAPNPYFGFTLYSEDNLWKPDYVHTGYGFYDPMAKGVKISDERLDHVLDFARDDQHPPMIPNWINQLAEVDSYIWNECVLDTSYTCRMTNAEKYHMDLLLQAHKKVAYEDYIHNIHAKVGIAGGEQVVNGGFENIMWMTGWNTDEGGNYSVVATNPHTGTYCCTTDATDYIDIAQDFSPIPVDAIKSFKMWYRTTDVPLAELDFYTTDDTYIEAISLANTSGVWTQLDIKAIMTANGITGNLTRFDIIIYTTNDVAIDDVSLIAELRGAWISKIEAQYNSVANWMKPWEVTVYLEANNSETESRTANVYVSSSFNDSGSMYLDELPQSYQETYIPTTQNCGVHIFYFFQPTNGSIWDGWTVYGEALVLDKKGETPNGIGGEHILTVLIYGDCQISAVFHYPSTCFTIVEDSRVMTNVEQITNGGFETTDFTGWTTDYPSQEVVTIYYPHSGVYCCKFLGQSGEEYSNISQDFSSSPIVATNITNFTFWAKSTGSFSSGEFYVKIKYKQISTGTFVTDEIDYSSDDIGSSWTKIDLSSSLRGSDFEIIEVGFYGIQSPYATIYLDDISLIAIEILIRNLGYITVNGDTSGCLPDDYVGSLEINTPYSLEWTGSQIFIEWQVICGDVTIGDTLSQSTTITINSGTIAWISALYDCPAPEVTLLNTDFYQGFVDWNHVNCYLSGGAIAVAESTSGFVANPSFGTGDFTGWLHDKCTIANEGFDDDYSVHMSQSGAYIEQTLADQETEAKSPINVTFMAKGTGSVKIITYYMDDTNESNTWTLANYPACSWGQGYPCLSYFVIPSKVPVKIRFEWVSGDFEIDTINVWNEINYGYVEQQLSSPIKPTCLDAYDLVINWKGYYHYDFCSTWWRGKMQVIFELDDNTTVTVPWIYYNQTGGWQQTSIHLSDYVTGKTIIGIKVELSTDELGMGTVTYCNKVALELAS